MVTLGVVGSSSRCRRNQNLDWGNDIGSLFRNLLAGRFDDAGSGTGAGFADPKSLGSASDLAEDGVVGVVNVVVVALELSPDTELDSESTVLSCACAGECACELGLVLLATGF